MPKRKITGFLLILFIAFSVAGCSLNKNENYISGIDQVNKLFELKNTYVGDASKVREIVDLANKTEYAVDSIELKTDSEPYRITVNFKVDNRAKYRYIDENELNRMSALMFSLIQNADEMLYLIFDDYSDKSNPDDSFYGSYYTKDNLCERLSSDKITVQYIEKSANTLEAFEEFYKTVMATEVAEPDRRFRDKLYEFIGDDNEVIINSGISAEVELDKLSQSDSEIISEKLPNDIGKYQGAGIKAVLSLYDIRNFKTNEVKQCVLLHYLHSDEGAIMIESDFVDKVRYNKILKLIMKYQSK